MPQAKQTKYTYEGPVYIRPIGRGMVLNGEGKPDSYEGEYLADVLNRHFGDGPFNMKISFGVLPQDEKKPNGQKHKAR